MDLTIIIPHKNDINRLNELLQTIPFDMIHECIVVDDDSDEFNAPSLIKQHFENVIFVLNKYSKGAGGARNTGLDIATGKWLIFADSDDLFTKDAFDILKSAASDLSDVIFFPPDSFREDDNSSSIRHERYSGFVKEYQMIPSKINEINLRYRFVIPTSKLISRDLILKYNIRFEESIYANDNLFSVKVGYYSKSISSDSRVIYKINHRDGSLTSQINRASYDTRLNEFIKTSNFLRQNLFLETLELLNYSYAAKSYIFRSIYLFKSPMYTFKIFLRLRNARIKIFNLRDFCFFEKNNYFRISIGRFLRGSR